MLIVHPVCTKLASIETLPGNKQFNYRGRKYYVRSDQYYHGTGVGGEEFLLFPLVEIWFRNGPSKLFSPGIFSVSPRIIIVIIIHFRRTFESCKGTRRELFPVPTAWIIYGMHWLKNVFQPPGIRFFSKDLRTPRIVNGFRQLSKTTKEIMETASHVTRLWPVFPISRYLSRNEESDCIPQEFSRVLEKLKVHRADVTPGSQKKI